MTSRLALACIIATGIVLIARIAEAQGRVPVDPTPLMAPLATAVQIGDGYGNLDLPLEVRITVLEVLRGEKAWALIKEAGEFDQPPNTGFEYLFARIRFEYLAKTGNYTASMDSFSATSAEGKEYETPSVKPPRPAFGGRLFPGDSLEGWIAFLVARDDSKPLMTFGQTGIQGPGRVLVSASLVQEGLDFVTTLLSGIPPGCFTPRLAALGKQPAKASGCIFHLLL